MLLLAILGASCAAPKSPDTPVPAAPVAVPIPPSPAGETCKPRARLRAVSLEQAAKLDGELDEWPRPSRFVSEPCTLELEAALRDDGLYLAGRATADVGVMHEAPRLELELAFGFPALAFGAPSIGHHLGRREIGSAAACADAEAAGTSLTPADIDSCEQWLESARAFQERLAEELVHGFTVDTLLAASGRSFEAFLPNAVLPPVPGYPVQELWLWGVLSPGNVTIETLGAPGAPGACSGCPEPFRGRLSVIARSRAGSVKAAGARPRPFTIHR